MTSIKLIGAALWLVVLCGPSVAPAQDAAVEAEVARAVAELYRHPWPGAGIVANPMAIEFNFTEPMRKILAIGPPAQKLLLEKLSDSLIKDQAIILLGGVGDERAVGAIIEAMVARKNLSAAPNAERINFSANVALTNITVADVIWYYGGGIVIDRCPRDPKRCWRRWWKKNRGTFSVKTIKQSRNYSNYPNYGIYRQTDAGP